MAVWRFSQKGLDEPRSWWNATSVYLPVKNSHFRVEICFKMSNQVGRVSRIRVLLPLSGAMMDGVGREHIWTAMAGSIYREPRVSQAD